MRTNKETLERTSREQDLKLYDRRVKWNRLVIMLVVLVVTVAVVTSCPSPGDGGRNNVSIGATWIEPHVVGDSVSIQVSEVENHRNVHFRVGTESGDMHFMAYVLNGQIHVRASVCPPCRGIGYSLDKDVLVCDMCATTFSARTGDGIKGACVNYPKSAVPYDTVDGSIVMNKADFLIAYENTLAPGWP